MNGEADLITVFRSADDDAHEEAEAIVDLLSGEGLAPVLLDDSAPGVPEGAYEVRVPPEQSARAEELIGEAHLPDDELTNVNETSDMQEWGSIVPLPPSSEERNGNIPPGGDG